MSDEWSKSCVQVHWNSEWFGGFEEILKWEHVKYTEADLKEFSQQMCLTNNDLWMLKNSCLEFCINKCLMNVQNGTSHSSVIESLIRLEG